MTGLTRASLITLIFRMRFEDKVQSTLRLLMPKDDIETLKQYLSILDELQTTTTYKAEKDRGKFVGYLFTIKLKPI